MIQAWAITTRVSGWGHLYRRLKDGCVPPRWEREEGGIINIKEGSFPPRDSPPHLIKCKRVVYTCKRVLYTSPNSIWSTGKVEWSRESCYGALYHEKF